MSSHCCQSYLTCTGIEKLKALFPYRPCTQGNNGYIFRDVIGCVEYLRFMIKVKNAREGDLLTKPALRSASDVRLRAERRRLAPVVGSDSALTGVIRVEFAFQHRKRFLL